MVNIKILNKFELTEDEMKFAQSSDIAGTAIMNSHRVISDLYLSKTLELVTERVIESNRILSDSNVKYTKQLVWVTCALVFVGVLQVLAQCFR